MLTLMYNLVKYAVGYGSAPEDDPDREAMEILWLSMSETASDRSDKGNALIENESYNVGTVTLVKPDIVLIDNHYVCDRVNVLVEDIKVDDRVRYLLSPSYSERNPEVKKIISASDPTWDDEASEPKTDPGEAQTLVRSVIGKVVERRNRIVIVEPNGISVDLNKVQSDFIPVTGDWLKLESVVKVDEEAADLSGDIVEVNTIKSLRSQVGFGVVTKYDADKGFGVIGNSIAFSRAACDTGYVPCAGDRVYSDSIESDQGLCTWRALNIVPVNQVAKEETRLSSLYSLDITKEELDDLLRDKHGVVITDSPAVNLDVDQERSITVRIQNTGDTAITLLGGYFHSKKQLQLQLRQPSSFDATLVLGPGDSVSYEFTCRARFIGETRELFVFRFKDFQIGRVFLIKVNSILGRGSKPANSRPERRNKLDVDQLTNQTDCVPGVRPFVPPMFIKVRNVVFKVPRHYWDLVLGQGEPGGVHVQEEIEKAVPSLSRELCFETYKNRFHALLHFEEIAQRVNTQQYDMESVVLERAGDYFKMAVPGLAEKRPSLLVGDAALITFKWDQSQGKLRYEGYIHRTTSDTIYLKFNQKFHQDYNNEDCRVSFRCSNSTIQQCHNAVNLAMTRLGPSFLFPTRVVQREPQLLLDETPGSRSQDLDDSSSSRSSSSDASNGNRSTESRSSKRVSVVERLFTARNEANEQNLNDGSVHSVQGQTEGKDTRRSLEVNRRRLVWFNRTLNQCQKEAVRNILQGFARPLPYVIFGPPGTGKTMTVCEAVLQIYSVLPESRLLVATPSNSSANLIAERLLDSGVLKPGDMVRLLAHHCLNSNLVPDRLLPYCATAEIAAEGTVPGPKRNNNNNGPRLHCSMSALGRHRITIGTCQALGVLYNMGFPRGHFSHVLVDEAGQATEPEILIPLNFVHSDQGQVVLAGDPLQLGPVVESRIAKDYGLDRSFLVRLLERFPYQRDPDGFVGSVYDPRLVTKLVDNYRSLPEILELSSSLFYESELQSQICPIESAEAKILSSLAAELPEREGQPPAIIFHGVNGENVQDEDSPSWYNPEEAMQAYVYLLRLYRYGLTPDDIGIITPYRKQVHQIRDLLLELDVDQPKISSVEGFQGQERNVIIISAVRSSRNVVQEDVKHSLGFVACPRRLNVAITRARALLIVLGNPRLLSLDPYWRSVLAYCSERGAYTGCTFVPEEQEQTLFVDPIAL